MAAARSDAACTAGCHLPDGSTSLHAAHADGGAACTACHPVEPDHQRRRAATRTTRCRRRRRRRSTGFTPSAGAPGTAVTRDRDARFTRAHRRDVRRACAPSTFRVLSDTRLTAVVPFGAATGPVAVANAGGTGTSTADFVVPGRVRARLTARRGAAHACAAAAA